MKIVLDTSALMAVVANEPEKEALIAVTTGTELLAPPSLHWEVGNAFSVMLRRKRVTLAQVEAALDVYRRIPLRWVDTDLAAALALAAKARCYAYDAYVVQCARQQHAPLLSLDGGLVAIARLNGVECLEIRS